METVIVVGAGHAGAQVVSQLRDKGFDGDILLVGNECHLPYQRPPLSKHYLKDQFDTARLFFKPETFYHEKNIRLLLDQTAVGIDVAQQQVLLQSGEYYHYDHCILACGARVRRLEVPGSQLEGIHYLRSINDADAIKTAMSHARKIAICGGGYIGLEIAAIAREKQLDVNVIEMASSLLARVAPPEIAQFYQALHQQAGVTVYTGKTVTGFEGEDQVQGVRCADGSLIEADMVVLGIGVLPNSELAEQAGLNVDNGIVVNEYCQSSNPKVYAIGDCAVHFNQRYQRPLRLESVQNALGQAKVAAANICGQPVAYEELPWFWSDQYDLKLQIAGLHEDYDQVLVRGDTGERKFAYFYLNGKIIQAVYAVNDPQSFMFSKKLIADRIEINPEDLTNLAVSIKEFAESGE